MSDSFPASLVSTPVAVFDLDGTLYDKRGLALRLIVAQRANLGLLVAERRARRALSGMDFGDAESFYKAFFECIAAETDRTCGQVAEWYNGSYMPSMVAALASGFRLRPWVEPVFASLHGRGVRVAVFSDYPFARQKLLALGFRPEWADAGVFDSASFGGLKPSRESFLRLASAIGVPPSEITVIGDRADTDVEGARRSGMSSILI